MSFPLGFVPIRTDPLWTSSMQVCVFVCVWGNNSGSKEEVEIMCVNVCVCVCARHGGNWDIKSNLHRASQPEYKTRLILPFKEQITTHTCPTDKCKYRHPKVSRGSVPPSCDALCERHHLLCGVAVNEAPAPADRPELTAHECPHARRFRRHLFNSS